jgi:drug/metabolite transporter (DMT)-like permease
VTRLNHGSAARISPLGLVFLTITSFGWGLNFPIMKNLLSEWPPLSSRGLCGVAGAGCLHGLRWPKGKS